MERENNLVLFRNYGNPLIAQFHKALLEENGIPCVIKDLGFNFPGSFFSDDASGIKLLVRHRDLHNAYMLMSNEEDGSTDPGMDQAEDNDPELDNLDMDLDDDDLDDLDLDDEDLIDFDDDDLDDDDLAGGFDFPDDLDDDEDADEIFGDTSLFDDEDLESGFTIDPEEEDRL